MGRLSSLAPRVATLNTSSVASTNPSSWRAEKTSSTARGYGYKWQKARERYLRLHPLCVMCEAEKPRRITPATIVDHKTPHGGDMQLFWDESNWQSLCKPHHDSDKQRQEKAKGL